ncbi:MAG: hypothetical protein KAH67_07905 [Flavobacteriaceae bacterium]|nr:hypothetical protein [Flavobacteriaceae bacterium]
MKKVLVVLGIVLVSYFFWSKSGRNGIDLQDYNSIEYFPIFEKDSSKSNIVGIQPFMTNLDYQNRNSFYLKMDFYMKEGQNKNWFKENTIVVFPEHVASWLVAVNEKKSIYKAKTIDDAMQIIVLSNLPKFTTNFLRSNAEDKASDAVFQMKANIMLDIYSSVYSELAIKYKVTIVGGSIFLPNPSVMNGELKINKGDIYNVSAVFLPDGKVEEELIKKKYPISTELPFCDSFSKDLPVFSSVSGIYGIAICADSWHEDIYQDFDDNNTKTIIVPSYSTGYGIWANKWPGYNGSDTPTEIDLNDVKNITLREAWYKYTTARTKNYSIENGITVFLRGDIWDLGTDGNSFIYRNDSIQSVPKTNMPVIFNVEM